MIEESEERSRFSLRSFNMWGNLQNDFASSFYLTNANDSETKNFEYDSQNRRIIYKNSLYQPPELFYENEDRQDIKFESSESLPNENESYDWTQHNWLKAGQKSPQIGSKMRKVKQNILQKRLNEALAKPLNIVKAERMMKKMGWSGGALGKKGEGIKEPVVVNAAYATSSKGLGLVVAASETKHKTKNTAAHEQNNRMNASVDKHYKESFNTNTLLHILDFVCDDTEVEIVFDKELSKKERKCIHSIVNQIMDTESVIPMCYDNVAQMDIVQQIHNNCIYLLGTYSEHVDDNHRQLCVYKEAHDHIFLITPNDLNYDSTGTKADFCIENPKDSINAVQEINCNNSSIEGNILIRSHNKESPPHKVCNKENENSTEVIEKQRDTNVISKITANKETVTKTEENSLGPNENTKSILVLSSGKKSEYSEKDESEVNPEKVCEFSNLECQNEKTEITSFEDDKQQRTKTRDECPPENKFDIEISENEEINIDNEPASERNSMLNLDISNENDLDNAIIDTNISERLRTMCNIEDSFDPKIVDKLLEYILEFASNEDFKEFRFLGFFDCPQIDSINYFFDSIFKCLHEDKFDVFGNKGDELKRLFKCNGFQYSIREDFNESVVIYKNRKTTSATT